MQVPKGFGVPAFLYHVSRDLNPFNATVPWTAAMTSSKIGHVHDFEWLPFAQLATEYFYPIFLKKSIFELPDHLEIRTEYE